MAFQKFQKAESYEAVKKAEPVTKTAVLAPACAKNCTTSNCTCR